MRLKFTRKNQLALLYGAGSLLLIATFGFWFIKTNTDPERVFWRAIERSMSTQGVTIEAEQSEGDATVKQVIRYSLGASNLSHSITTLSQNGTTVQNEMIGTPDTDYYRYLNVATDQTRADGSPIDFSNVIGVWTKSEEGAGQSFAQALLGGSLPVGVLGVPIGNLSEEARDELIRQIQNDHVYEVAFDAVKKERKSSRMLYTYEVSIQPVAYVALIKQFAQTVGLHSLDDVDPGMYEGQQAFKLDVTIDVWANQVVRISDPATGNSQTYSGYDIPVQVRPPKDVISAEEMQKRLSELQ
ncbi:hypothetical protein IRY61_01045 [Candidatus Saccharibacteria bacterium]|nr:hypothetical protein [Candidatus Saccharibacteria bacterium]